ncbi:efflux RND transporter permease subunit [Candidatus Poriferisodalis sp.]|uniref:efflux RND transporter permease subunit n=1 Tax=Candidatus Poriferisodalis sp. TaxID=3101277 RepID=UPI003B5A007D
MTAKPKVTLVALLLVTVGIGAGVTRMAPQAESTAFLPKDSAVAQATETIDAHFGGKSDITSATVLFRGDVLTPVGLAQIDAVVTEASSHPAVSGLLVGPASAPTVLLERALGTDDFASLSQQEIDDAAASVPALGRMVGTDVDGSQVATANFRLFKDLDGDGDFEDDAETLTTGELTIRDVAEESSGPLAGSSLSSATVAEETQAATGSEMLLLMVLALAVIAVLLLLFTRSLFDLALSLVGLVVTIVWVMGSQGWLGPEGLGWIGPPNTLTTMVPIVLIGLVVDYAIQTVSLYREQRAIGADVRSASRVGLATVIVPLSLAAVTTIVSFLTNLTSPVPANGDFGVVAGVGVASGLIVMLTLLAAARAMRDLRRERRGKLKPARPISGAIPGVGPAVEALGGVLARRPTPFMVIVAAVTIVLGAASTQIDTVFDTRDFLPSGGDAIADLETLDAAFGGEADAVKVLIEAEITDDRTVRNVLDFSTAFNDDLRRPEGVVGGIESSLGLLLLDWITDDGTEGDLYDVQLRTMAEEANEFRLDPVALQAIINRLESLDPEGFAAVAVNNPDGPDTLLIQFQALTGDQERAKRMVADIEGLWFGPAEQITATSGEIVGVEVVGAMTDSQTSSIMTTILAALVILCIFFWIVERRPSLGFIAVGPIVLVLFWVLGTMTLLGIPYNAITALITALSIGIGVDYTIHIIHRYEGEFERSHDPVQAARRTLRTTGSALLGSALTTALAFGVLMFSSLSPFQQFGMVTAITIAYALIAAIVVVPPSMILWAAYRNFRLRTAIARADVEEIGV